MACRPITGREGERVIAAAAVVAVAILAAAAQPAPRVLVRVDDEAVAGALAIALTADGIVVTPESADATHEVIAARRDGGWVITCVGAQSKGASVLAGPAALAELELQHRAASLVRQTQGRLVETTRDRVVLVLADRGVLEERLGDKVAHALVEAGVSLAPPEAANARLCVDAAPDVVTLSWGENAVRCDGRPVAVTRADLAPRVLVAEALRLREAAPLRPLAVAGGGGEGGDVGGGAARAEPPPVPPAADTPRTEVRGAAEERAPAPAVARPTPGPLSAASPASPASPASMPAASPPPPEAAAFAPAIAPLAITSVSVGALGREPAFDPFVSVEVGFPVFSDIGPAFLVDGSGSVGEPLIGEALVAGGVGGAWRLHDRFRVRAGLLVGAFTHGWWFDDTDAGFAFDPAVVVPVALDVRATDLMSVTVGAQAGAMGRSRIHKVGDEITWNRDALFLAISVGLTFDTTPGRAAVEN